jgi:hypothetical protein
VKLLLGVLIGTFITGSIVGAFYIGKLQNTKVKQSPVPSVEITFVSPSPISSAQVMAIVETSSKKTGKVEGKLCYPSEFLPEGKITAKDMNGKITSLDYPGSQKGGKNTYSMDLAEGKYNLRYEPGAPKNTDYFGYHTLACPTGLETTCSDTKQRVLISATVEAGKTISNFDLCDFYYTKNNTPQF